MNLLVILCVFAAVTIELAFPKKWYKKTPSRRHSNQDDSSEECQSGDGSSYRGSISKTKTWGRCLRWNRFRNPWGTSAGLGDHRHCRNPDQSLMPWCRVRRGKRVVREFCDIPKCSTTVQPSVATDTELTCGEMSQRMMHRIVGGSFVAIQSQPWLAAIFHQRSNFLCGGSLVAPCWVLTAAHCFPDGAGTNIQRLSVFLGKSAINETDDVNEQKFTVEKVILHQAFNATTYNNDIALLKIKSSDGGCAVQTESARTVCLPPPHTQLPVGFQCITAGFGKQKSRGWQYSQYLKEARVNLLSQSDCKKDPIYDNLITDNMLCAAGPNWSTDACEGDSGGPLVCEASGRMFLFGLVSWGIGCAKENNPGVYTQLTNYNNWIAEKTELPKYAEGVMYPQK
ncbi:urokinase-type plasminogen activator-like [Nerophis lumbriciformis]|uniref:urokinase-type plasminogen activator-like n=1 Tax=Nerophis lumbriciformis TaxID=546530 RepID=UPI002ADF1C4B|nr:tissue-type plasminogen activator-like [Nerophis lumbriciformis]XP_061810089.1 tissue-type plasminogen activator-like [Nerophis lumbriciformis]